VVEQGDKGRLASKLVEIAAERCVELFFAPDGDTYATIAESGHQETHAIDGPSFREWVRRILFKTEGSATPEQALNEAVATLQARARYEGSEQGVFIRAAHQDGKIYLDLGDSDWRAVEINTNGWRIVNDPPVRFRRTKGMRPLPVPVPGGTVNELRGFVNLESDSDFVLLVGVIVAAFNPKGPYFILEITGQHGAAKSTVARIVVKLVDPSIPELRTAPSNERDLMIAANSTWCLAFDNLSQLSHWLSDALCRLSTGGGFSTRKLYTNGEEFLIDVRRPCVLNGVEELAIRGDLLDRTISLHLPSVPPEKRRAEAEFWNAFENVAPRLFGAFLTAVSAALRDSGTIQVARLPRLADAVLWVSAAESAFGWKPGTFLKAYEDNHRAASQRVVEGDTIAVSVAELAKEGKWEGTATDLVKKLKKSLLPAQQRNPGAVAGMLRRIEPNLKSVGVDLTFYRTGRKGTRMIRIQESSQSRQHRQRRRRSGRKGRR
jgi:hypothetical protein